MSTRTTFEDRLLDELKREIALRHEAGVSEAGAPESRATPSVRRLVTPRRIALAAAACAVAGLAAVVVPGSPTDSTAYAVESHGDGSVTLTVKDQSIGIRAQHELATRLHPWGIQVTVDVLTPGYACERSKVRGLWAVNQQGEPVAVFGWQARRKITLRRGNVLVFENTRGDSEPYAVKAYAAKDEVKPCVPVKPTPPDN